MSNPRFTELLFGALLMTAAACGPADNDDPDGEMIYPGDPRFVRDPALNVENISAHGEKRSHNMGMNCMSCHQAYGPGKGIFTAAGTMYIGDNPAPGGSVELRTAPSGQGDLILAIEVDDNGNFFTTEATPLPDQALFPFVRGADGATTFMPFPSISGACNVCHTGARKVHLEQ